MTDLEEISFPKVKIIKTTQYSIADCKVGIHTFIKAINAFRTKCMLCGFELKKLKEVASYPYKYD